MIDTEHDADYLEGKAAFQAGKRMADKPAHLLKTDWDAGFIDAMAALIRAHTSAGGSAGGLAPRK